MAETSGFASHESRIEQRQLDQDRTLEAMQQLEATLEAPAPGRECSWRDGVGSALEVLADAVASESDNAARPDSLLSDLARSQPHLRNRVRGLRIQYRQLQEAIDSLRGELGAPGQGAPDFADYRQRLAWVLGGLRHQRSKESDLIYEAYYDAFRSDLPRDVEVEHERRNSQAG